MRKIKLTLLALCLASASFAQTIPNGGFETWTNMGTYGEPDSWATLNMMTSTAATFTAQQGSGNVGTSCLKLTSRNVTGMGVMPGVATSGVLNQTTFQPVSGFAYNIRSANLTGKWQHMISGSSQGYVDVQLTRWDAGMNMRMPVATGHLTLSGMAMSWASFSVPLSYSDNVNNPDSCMITLSASGTAPTDGDYLWVDALAFTGTVAPLAITDIANNISDVKIFPNPTNVNAVLQIDGIKTTTAIIQLVDINGKLIQEIYSGNIQKGDNKFQINSANLSNGLYQIKINIDGKILNQKLTVAH